MAKKSSVSLNDVSTWTMPVVLLFGAVIVVLLFFLIQRLLVSGVTSQVKSKNSQIIKQEQEYARNQKIVALLPLIRKEVAELEIVRDEAKQYLPTEVSMPSLIDNVYRAARDNGIVFNRFTPEADLETEYYTIKPISLSANAGYLSMSSFIEQVTTLKRIMNVQSVSFDVGNRDKKEQVSDLSDKPLEMTATLQTYIFKEEQDDKVKK